MIVFVVGENGEVNFAKKDLQYFFIKAGSIKSIEQP